MSSLDLSLLLEQPSCLGPFAMKLAGEARLNTTLPLPRPWAFAIGHIRTSFGEWPSLHDDRSIKIMPQHVSSLRIPQDVSCRDIAV